MNKQAGYSVIGAASIFGAVYLSVNALWIMAAVLVFLAVCCIALMGAN